MATTSEQADSTVNVTSGGEDDKNKKKEEGVQKQSSQPSPSDGVQGEQKTEKVDGSHQAEKSVTTAANEQEKPQPVSITSNTKTEKTNEVKPESTASTTTTTTKTSERKEESESPSTSSTSPTVTSGQKEETTKSVASSSPSSGADNEKNEPTTPLTTSTDAKKEDPTETTSKAKTDNNAEGKESTSQQDASDAKKDDNTKDQSSTSLQAASQSKKENETKNAPSSALQNTAPDADKAADNTFTIEKGDAQHLTDFQRQKAKYFFNVNLDLKNNESVSWDEVEFYLLFHETIAGKEGSSGGDLEDRLSRAARAFWENVHDQVPSPDKSRDKLTLDQFLDTWASLVDYVVKTNQLPPIVRDLVKLGFELYATDAKDGKPETIQPDAFDKLFQKMNLGRPFALLAYKNLTESGTKPLDANRVDSIVKAVVTSSDNEHDSHFLLPGFFKTISNTPNAKDKNDVKPASGSEQKESKTSEKHTAPQPQTTTTTTTNESSSSSQQQQQPSKTPASPAPPNQQKATEPAPSESQQEQLQKSSVSPSSQGQEGANSPTANLTSNQQTPGPLPSNVQKAIIQKEDDGVRRLLQYYRIDDSDLFEVAAGSVHRLVLAHPERPLPAYIQQNKELLQILRTDPTKVSSTQQNQSNDGPNQLTNNAKPSSTPSAPVPAPESHKTPAPAVETKPKVTLEERISRGEAQKGPTVPLPQQAQRQESSSATGVRQVYPQLNPAQQEDQQRQAKLQATLPPQDEQEAAKTKSTVEESSSTKEGSSPKKEDLSKHEPSSSMREITDEEKDRIVAAVLEQITPIVEKRVAAEIRRVHSGDTDQDDDEDHVPFPYKMGDGFPMFGSAGGLLPQMFRQQQNGASQGHQQTDTTIEGDFDGMQVGGSFIPPQLLMALMSDLSRGAAGGEFPGFPSNMPPPPGGPGSAPTGVEGFIVFGDDGQMMGSPAGYPQRPGPQY